MMVYLLLLLSHFPVLFSNEATELSPAKIPSGIWIIPDEKTGEMRSEVEFYLRRNKLRAKVVEVKKGHENARCEACPGNLNNVPLLGMDIIWDLEWDGRRWSGGSIIGVDDAKIYSCRITSFDEKSIDIRGYIGRPVLGRTVTWVRKK